MRRPLAFLVLLIVGVGGLAAFALTRPRGPAAPATDDAVASKATQGDLLTIGSKAPLLDVSFWLDNASGKQPPVTQFEAGKVYVIEFWATWCGPCIATIPHVAQLQREFADSGVQVLSISSESPTTVNAFLDRSLGLGDASTYRDLTSGYRIGSDPDSSTASAYMAASGHNGIPISYVVGTDGHIEWIGPPRLLDEPLTQIVDGRWDRAAFAVEYKDQKEVQDAFELATQKGKIEEALSVLRRVKQTVTNPRTLELAETYLEIVELGKMEQLAVKSTGPLPPELEQYFADKTPEQGHQFTRLVLLYANEGKTFSPAVMDFAVRLAERVAKESPLTQHLAHHAILLAYTDKLDEAAEVQQRAVKSAGDSSTRAKMQRILDTINKVRAERAAKQ